MTDQTRALLDLARDGDDPTDDDRARLRQAVMLAVAGGAAAGATAAGAGTASASAALHASAAGGAASASTPAAVVSSIAAGSAASAGGAVTAASVAGVTSLGAIVTKAVLALAAVGAVSVGVAMGPSDLLEPSGPRSTDPSDRTTEVSASGLHAEATRNSDAVALPEAPPVVEAAEVAPSSEATFVAEVDVAPSSSRPAPSPASARLRPRAPNAVASVPSEAVPPVEVAPSIGEEVVLLRRATAARRAGDAPRALALLDAHAQRFPAAVLAPERAAARVLTLCDLGSVDEGREAAARFAVNHPSSPLLGRVRAACE
ncbi:MAG: hypothetical protein JRH11_23710 [Deltaproteobacteria bacterium]|nr:hypothetical protein [Deltaproteobacteria bacterium]